jgi:hypothetical protein
MHTVHGEPSFHLATPELDLDITLRGGQLAPVVFHLPGRDVSPYALAPWEPAEFPDQPPLLSVLRGDFLCLPFGGQSAGPPHGETANCDWTKLDSDERSLKFEIKTQDTGASVVKTLATRQGQHAIYFTYQISNLDGDFNYGNHPILDFSGLTEGAARVTTSAFHWGSVFPGVFSNPADGETQALAEGAVFSDLREVALAAGGTTDLTRYPSRPGNDDLVMFAHVPASEEQPFAWTAARFDGHVWFSLKNPADFPSTLLWFSNAGRMAAPWNGRHSNRLGVEDVCSYFSNGVDISRLDLLAAEGIPTTRRFHANETVTLKVIHGVALVPGDFSAIRQILPDGDHHILIFDDLGQKIRVPLDWKFLAAGEIK